MRLILSLYHIDIDSRPTSIGHAHSAGKVLADQVLVRKERKINKNKNKN